MGLAGKRGLAIPSSAELEAIFEEDKTLDGLQVDWHAADASWKRYLGGIIQGCAESRGDAFRGRLWIKNALPLGKGMGSSTALVVAVCRALLGKDCEGVARHVEDVMNPGQSGMDFAVIWRAGPVIFRKGEEPVDFPIPIPLPHPVLVDTGSPDQSTPELVAWLTKRKDERVVQDALEAIGRCTDRLLEDEPAIMVFPDHHAAQLALGVVPPKTAELVAAIQKAGGAAKVIGAGARTGGGGMVLAIHPAPWKLDEALKGYKTMPL